MAIVAGTAVVTVAVIAGIVATIAIGGEAPACLAEGGAKDPLMALDGKVPAGMVGEAEVAASGTGIATGTEPAASGGRSRGPQRQPRNRRRTTASPPQ